MENYFIVVVLTRSHATLQIDSDVLKVGNLTFLATISRLDL